MSLIEMSFIWRVFFNIIFDVQQPIRMHQAVSRHVVATLQKTLILYAARVFYINTETEAIKYLDN